MLLLIVRSCCVIVRSWCGLIWYRGILSIRIGIRRLPHPLPIRLRLGAGRLYDAGCSNPAAVSLTPCALSFAMMAS